MTTVRIPASFLRQVDFIPEGVTPPCQDEPEKFFPPLGATYDEGRAICHRCKLEAACGDWAVDTNQQHGLWGGLDPEQRALRRKVRQVLS